MLRLPGVRRCRSYDEQLVNTQLTPPKDDDGRPLAFDPSSQMLVCTDGSTPNISKTTVLPHTGATDVLGRPLVWYYGNLIALDFGNIVEPKGPVNRIPPDYILLAQDTPAPGLQPSVAARPPGSALGVDDTEPPARKASRAERTPSSTSAAITAWHAKMRNGVVRAFVSAMVLNPATSTEELYEDVVIVRPDGLKSANASVLAVISLDDVARYWTISKNVIVPTVDSYLSPTKDVDNPLRIIELITVSDNQRFESWAQWFENFAKSRGASVVGGVAIVQKSLFDGKEGGDDATKKTPAKASSSLHPVGYFSNQLKQRLDLLFSDVGNWLRTPQNFPAAEFLEAVRLVDMNFYICKSPWKKVAHRTIVQAIEDHAGRNPSCTLMGAVEAVRKQINAS